MKSFQCLVNGTNFLLNMDGAIRKYGFYKTVFVDSPDVEQAQLAAVEYVKSSELQDMVLNSKDDTPLIFVEEIYELEQSAVGDNKPGQTFYVDKKWWQFWK